MIAATDTDIMMIGRFARDILVVDGQAETPLGVASISAASHYAASARTWLWLPVCTPRIFRLSRN